MSSDLMLNIVQHLGFVALPACAALCMARRATSLLVLWTASALLWTSAVTAGAPYGVDGQNGCEACDILRVMMLATSWLTFSLVGITRLVVVLDRLPFSQ